MQSSAAATGSGEQISTPGFDASSWLPVSNDDAGAPGTEVQALAGNGKCPGDPGLQPVNLSSDSTHSVFYSANMKSCYGQMTSVGPDTLPAFKVPWWWRTDFGVAAGSAGTGPGTGEHARLIVNGVIGAADVWVNGHQVATSATVTGAYTRFSFDVTGLLLSGTNSLAIEVQPNNPTTMFTVDDVDWNQIPPDNNTGIQFPVQLETDGPLSDGNAHVTENNAPDLSRSALTVQADITNNTAAAKTGLVTATVNPPAAGPPGSAPPAGAPVTVSQQVTVPAGTTQTVTFDPSKYPALDIAHPSVWWPYQLGPHPLYRLSTSVSQNGSTLNSTHETFGIRTVTSYLTGKSEAAPSGTRQFVVNGVPIVIRGGGFSPDLFLHYSAADTDRQIALMKNMGLNTLRLEGHLMAPDFFEQMDAAGMLINAGYQCCDAWELQGSGLTSPADYQIMKLSALTIGQSLRDHPSVFSFQWSDQPPLPEQESVTLDALHQAGFTDPVISSAEYSSSPQLGVSGEKEGPYDWVPPDYWYDTAHYDPSDPSRTNAGGSWAYDSEQSSGDTVPTLDSIQRFMSPAEQAELWRVYSLAGAMLDDRTASGITLAGQQVRNGVLHPTVPAATNAPGKAQVYFVELVLRRAGTVVDRNVYWRSTQPDEVNWAKTLGQPQAVLTRYADLKALQTLPKATVSAAATTAPGPDGTLTTTVTITNSGPAASAPAFLLRADVRRGTAGGQPLPGHSEIQPATWNGNDVTLWPGESQPLTVTYRAADLQGGTPVITLSGWNAAPVTASAPTGRPAAAQR